MFMKNTERDLAFYVVDIFEDLLDEKGIDIPCADTHEEEDRHDHENTAKIYGSEYWYLVDRIEELLKKARKETVQPVEEDD